jgi:hypothetical protein
VKLFLFLNFFLNPRNSECRVVKNEKQIIEMGAGEEEKWNLSHKTP